MAEILELAHSTPAAEAEGREEVATMPSTREEERAIRQGMREGEEGGGRGRERERERT